MRVCRSTAFRSPAAENMVRHPSRPRSIPGHEERVPLLGPVPEPGIKSRRPGLGGIRVVRDGEAVPLSWEQKKSPSPRDTDPNPCIISRLHDPCAIRLEKEALQPDAWNGNCSTRVGSKGTRWEVAILGGLAHGAAQRSRSNVQDREEEFGIATDLRWNDRCRRNAAMAGRVQAGA